jgi:hypothetical protein
MTQKNQLSKIRDYDRHKSRACVDLFLKVTRSINRDEIFDYVIFVSSISLVHALGNWDLYIDMYANGEN